MKHLRRSKRSLLLELILDSGLLIFWVLQMFLLICLLIYGHIPLPRDWLNDKLAAQSAAGIHIQAEKYKLHLNGSLEAHGLSIHNEDIEKPIIEVSNALIRYRLFDAGKTVNVKEVILADGTLYVPAVYAPNGQRSVFLERIAVDIELQDQELCVRSICAKHEDVSFRGALTIPFSAFVGSSTAEPKDPDEPGDPIGSFYEAVAKALEIRHEYHALTEPTLAFEITAASLDDIQIEALLSSPLANYRTITLQNTSIMLSAHYTEGTLAFSAPTVIEAESLDAPEYLIRGSNLSCQLTEDDWEQIRAMQWPSLELGARRIHVNDIRLDAPFFKLWRDAPGIVGFEGSAEGLDGSVDLEGAFDVLDRDAWVDASGSIDIYDVLPERMKTRLPKLEFGEAPHYNVALSFDRGFVLERAYFDVSMSEVSVDEIKFDQILARGNFSDKIATLNDLYVFRGDQQVYSTMRHDHSNGNFDVLVKGSLNPQDYSPLLPKWWDSIFDDFEITDESSVDADFIIQSNIQQGRTRYFYGSVNMADIEYSKVPISLGRVVVRGTPRYIEIHLLQAEGSEGSMEGAIAFGVLPDDKPSPVSLHLDVQLELSQEATKNLLGDVTYDRIVGDVEFMNTPYVSVEGISYYDTYYPEFAGKSYYIFGVDTRGPLTYENTPLDYLKLHGYADDTVTQLRDLDFGYAHGKGTGELDIFDRGEESNIINFRAELVNADEELAIANLPALDEFEDDLENDATEPAEGTGRLNATVHATGPIEDPFSFEGFGDFKIRDREIGTIRMLGPLSRVAGFTSFELDTVTSAFVLRERKAFFPDLRVDGPRTQINASGSIGLEDQALDLRVTVRLFGNATTDRNPINRITSVINPLAMLLRFRVTGTLEDQRIRSTLDPRNLLPGSGRKNTTSSN